MQDHKRCIPLNSVARRQIHRQFRTLSILMPSVSYIRVSPVGQDGMTMPRITLTERRAAGNRQLYFIFQRHLRT